MEKKPQVILPIENPARELHDKVLLASILIHRGYRVIILTKRRLLRDCRLISPSLIIFKSPGSKHIGKLLDAGHQFAVMDEESSPSVGAGYFLQNCITRYRALEGYPIAFVILPNKMYRDKFKKARLLEGVPLYVTGWPRTDLWKSEFQHLFAKDAKKIRDEFGRFYLFPSSFGCADPESLAVRLKRCSTKEDRIRHLFKYQALEEYIEKLRDFSESLKPEERLIIRPHPSEPVKPWESYFVNYKNVLVEKSGDLTPWLNSAVASIQFGSTAALQAVYHGARVARFEVGEHPAVTDSPAFDWVPKFEDATTMHEFFCSEQYGRTDIWELRGDDVFFANAELAASRVADVVDENYDRPSGGMRRNALYSGFLIASKLHYNLTQSVKTLRSKNTRGLEHPSRYVNALRVADISESVRQILHFECSAKVRQFAKEVVIMERYQ